jgi:hypothetical protein
VRARSDRTPSAPARETAALLRRWLASGRIQAPSGAFCAWRDGDVLSFEYPEITGYALTALAAYGELNDGEATAGMRAADWLVSRLEGGDRSAHAGWDEGAAYTFDLGMIAAGLISFGRLFHTPVHEQRGIQTARELAALISLDDGLPPLAPDGPASKRLPAWSNVGHPHLAKCVQSLCLADETVAAEMLMHHTSRFQADAGYFVTQRQDDFVMLHPHLYAVEALWMWGTARGDDSVLARARRATEWAWEHQLASGGLPRLVGLRDVVPDAPEQLDVTSQAVRAALLLGLAPPGLDRAIARLCDSAVADGPGASLPYQPQSGQRHLNAWVTMFGAQALELAGGRVELAWSELV